MLIFVSRLLFRHAREQESSHPRGGGLSGINSLLKDISKSAEDVRYNDQQDQAILFYHGERVVEVFFAQFYLDALYWKVRRLVTTIEAVYRPLLADPVDFPRMEEGMIALVAAEFGPAMGNPTSRPAAPPENQSFFDGPFPSGDAVRARSKV